MIASKQLWGILALALGVLAAATTQAEPLVRCESEEGRPKYCRVDTRGGVRLESQLSRSPCRYNESWGYDWQGIWVKNGCRAEFYIVERGGPGGRSGAIVRCESMRGKPEHCGADTLGGVSLERQLSETPCIYHETWGYDRQGIWVSDGCRGDFRLGNISWRQR
jgi:hypothetical protein